MQYHPKEKITHYMYKSFDLVVAVLSEEHGMWFPRVSHSSSSTLPCKSVNVQVAVVKLNSSVDTLYYVAHH